MIKTRYKKITPPEANFFLEKLKRKYFSMSKFSEKLSKNFLKRRLRRRILGASRPKFCPPTPNRWGDRLTTKRRLMGGCPPSPPSISVPGSPPMELYQNDMKFAKGGCGGLPIIEQPKIHKTEQAKIKGVPRYKNRKHPGIVRTKHISYLMFYQ